MREMKRNPTSGMYMNMFDEWKYIYMILLTYAQELNITIFYLDLHI